MKNSKRRDRIRTRGAKPASSIYVARLAGVSQSAVSRSFPAGTTVSEQPNPKVLLAAEELVYKPIPVVLFNGKAIVLGVASDCCDNVEAGRRLANLLLDTGRVRPAFISGSDEASANRDRKKGFLDRLAERGAGHVLIEGGEASHAVG